MGCRRGLGTYVAVNLDRHITNLRQRPAFANVTLPCGLSSPSSARSVVFSQHVSQFFSLWVWLQVPMAIPAWAVLQCGGHCSAAGCAPLPLPGAGERSYLCGAPSSRYSGIVFVVMARVWQNYPRPSWSLWATSWQFTDSHDEVADNLRR